VPKNRALKIIYEPQRIEENRRTEKIVKELHGLYSSSDMIRMIKSTRMRGAGHGRGETTCEGNTKMDQHKICRFGRDLSGPGYLPVLAFC
jgi:hypothetical protein